MKLGNDKVTHCTSLKSRNGFQSYKSLISKKNSLKLTQEQILKTNTTNINSINRNMETKPSLHDNYQSVALQTFTPDLRPPYQNKGINSTPNGPEIISLHLFRAHELAIRQFHRHDWL